MGEVRSEAGPDLSGLESELLAEISAADGLADLDKIRVSALGKKGRVSELMKTIARLDGDERKSFGQAVNGLKQRIGDALEGRKAALAEAELTARLANERADVTLPVRLGPVSEGRIHPVSQITEEMTEIFADMGFSIAEGPDIETDDNNFTKLNFPEDHPAREMHDTFFFREKASGERLLLRTHTSTVQVRTMLAEKPPIRIVAPGRVYRSDSDQTHTPMFHQVEGLVIEEGVHMGHLKWCLEEFLKAIFEVENVNMRFRPSYFPFTEPSAEVDIQCDRSGDVVRFGEGEDWMEILGCGMVHPNVLRNCGLDPKKYQGFAFGLGIDRIATLKYGMPDLRAFFSGDIRWLRHYGFSVLNVPTLAGGLSGQS